jgi:hypothetical protein
LTGIVTALLSLTAPRALLACAVCFGQSDSPLAAGINDGIFLMLGLIAVFWIAFGSFFIYLRRRARRLQLSHPQEGTL